MSDSKLLLVSIAEPSLVLIGFGFVRGFISSTLFLSKEGVLELSIRSHLPRPWTKSKPVSQGFPQVYLLIGPVNGGHSVHLPFGKTISLGFLVTSLLL